MCKTPRLALPTLQQRCLPRVNLPFTLTDPVHSPFTQSLTAPFPHAPSSKGSYVLGYGGWGTKDSAHAGGCYSVGNAVSDHCWIGCAPAQEEGEQTGSAGVGTTDVGGTAPSPRSRTSWTCGHGLSGAYERASLSALARELSGSLLSRSFSPRSCPSTNGQTRTVRRALVLVEVLLFAIVPVETNG